jgi:hypothetical protein
MLGKARSVRRNTCASTNRVAQNERGHNMTLAQKARTTARAGSFLLDPALNLVR